MGKIRRYLQSPHEFGKVFGWDHPADNFLADNVPDDLGFASV